MNKFSASHHSAAFIFSTAPEPKEIMMANEEMYNHLQKQAALLKTIDIKSMNDFGVKVEKLSKKLMRIQYCLNPFAKS